MKKGKHVNDQTVCEICATIKQLCSYGLRKREACRLIGIPLSSYHSYSKRNSKGYLPVKRIKKSAGTHAIREEEKDAIIEYALEHPSYYHRELAWKMIDENVAFVSMTTVYRILKGKGLICSQNIKSNYGWVHRYSNEASEPDELWQADITYLRYRGRDVYQLSFIDVFSRFIVYTITLLRMDGMTVSSAFEDFVNNNLKNLCRIPRLQTDNGSCFVGSEFRSLMKDIDVEHVTIHPSTPTENVIIERWHRTFKELLSEEDEPESFENLKISIANVCNYYNYKRYHASIGYITPYTAYRGKPQEIFDERTRKLHDAKLLRQNKNKELLSISY